MASDHRPAPPYLAPHHPPVPHHNTAGNTRTPGIPYGIGEHENIIFISIIMLSGWYGDGWVKVVGEWVDEATTGR